GAETIQLHRLLANWGEGASNSDQSGGGGGGATPTTNDATWIHRFFNTKFWTTPGGDFSSASSASISVDAAGTYTWASTARLVSACRLWLYTPSSNCGWLVLGDESTPNSPTTKRFDTRKNSPPATRPVLTFKSTKRTAAVDWTLYK